MMDWESLGFGYIKTDFNARCTYKDGKWGSIVMTEDEHIPMHIAATCLHYGQEAFEGLKAYEGADGKVRLFRVDENAKRMAASADYLQMAAPTLEVFETMVHRVVEANRRFVPPYGTGASLYIRPLLIGVSPQVGVKPSAEYLLLMFVTPVGPYYKEGFRPIKAIVDREHDRAAPLGTGHIKAGGNYGASLISSQWAHSMGYPSVLYLDAREKRYIDECGAANFFAIKDNIYITPKSHSVLPSITNMSLQQIATDMGLTVECRAVEFAELPDFQEAGCCGTAAVLSPIGEIYDPMTQRRYTFSDPDKAGAISTKMYERLRGIQLGDQVDRHGWVTVLE